MSNDALISYVAVMTVADQLLRKHIIDKKEFFMLEKAMMRKYSFPVNSIYRDFRIVCDGKTHEPEASRKGESTYEKFPR